MTITGKRPVSLGDLRAEDDVQMLESAFIETADYRTLIETTDRVVVVGRRGTGKSALTNRLQKYWRGVEEAKQIQIIPKEHQIIGLRPLIAQFDGTFNMVKAGSKLIWRYALLMELAHSLKPHYKSRKYITAELDAAINSWPSDQVDVTEKVRRTLTAILDKNKSAAELIGDLPAILDLEVLELAAIKLCNELGHDLILLIDRLDEGYEPDDVGVGFVDGLIQAAIHIRTKIPQVKPVIFVRDNIFRSVQMNDPDYTRNIEGHVLRLHWDEASLFNFATKRIAVVLDLKQEASLKIWNQCTAGDLSGTEGFSKCLRMTLYRPRDLLALLNEAFQEAFRSEDNSLTVEHIEASAIEISQNRYMDLIKEYSHEVPGLYAYTTAFNGKDPKQTVKEVSKALEEVMSAGSSHSKVQQDMVILQDAKSALRALYSIGFLGLKEAASGKFVFCHDGRSANKDISNTDSVLVHPCYWMAVNCNRTELSLEDAEDIYDEYDIEISSKTPEIRAEKIESLVKALEQVNEGEEESPKFEEWSSTAIRICFAKGLRNVDLIRSRVEKNSKQVTGTNLGEYGFWKQIKDAFEAKQLLFHVCNYSGLVKQDYDHVLESLDAANGKFAIIVSRDDAEHLVAGGELEWIRKIYRDRGILIIKVTANLLAKLLEKLKKPQKHDVVDNELHRLLDIYLRMYIGGEENEKIGKRNKRQIKKDLKKLQEEEKLKVLFLSADPSDATRLRLGEEFREAQEKLRLGNNRDYIRLETRTCLRPHDISQALLDFEPNIVHFSGHGTDAGELCFENIAGDTVVMEPEALSDMFKQFKNHVKCVVLSACFSDKQAKGIASHIEYVVGMSEAISDRAAIAFAIGFYQAIGAGCTVQRAFGLGVTQIQLQGSLEGSTPTLFHRGK